MQQSQAIEVRCLVEVDCSLGEGPMWDDRRQWLYWVDITANTIYRCDLAQKSLLSWKTPEYVGFVILKQDGDLIAGFKTGLHHVHLSDDGMLTAKRIDQLDDPTGRIRFNDGCADPRGRIWACSMDMQGKEPFGQYFRYDSRLRRTTVDEGYAVANGPALSPDGRWLYTVETVGHADKSKGIYIARIASDGLLDKPRLWVDWSGWSSYPDGLVTDTDGNVWIAEFGGNLLRCFNTDGQVIQEIALPAWNLTKPVFGGERLDVIYVTSARIVADEATLQRYPQTGSVFEVRGTGARGWVPGRVIA